MGREGREGKGGLKSFEEEVWNGLDGMGRGCRWKGEGYGLGREEKEGRGGKENERKK